jgi:hypothetical protein
MQISIYPPFAKERFETARQHSILHPGTNRRQTGSDLMTAYRVIDKS